MEFIPEYIKTLCTNEDEIEIFLLLSKYIPEDEICLYIIEQIREPEYDDLDMDLMLPLRYAAQMILKGTYNPPIVALQYSELKITFSVYKNL